MFAKAVAFLGGTLVVCQLPTLAPFGRILPVLGVAAVLLLWRRLGWLAALLAGILWAWQVGQSALTHSLDPAVNGRQWIVSGEVASVPQLGAGFRSFDLTVREGPAAIGRLRRIRVSWYDSDVDVRAGERWRLRVRLRHAHGVRNPGDYDYEGRLFDQGVDATGYVVRCPCNERIRAATWRTPVLELRAAIAQRISAALPASPYVGILQNLAVGLDERVTREQWQAFAATGTTHLMAISGFHVAGVALFAMWLVRLAWRSGAATGPARTDVESAIGMAAAVGYALLAGLSVPTQRTLVTLAIVLGARLLRRSTAIWDLFGLALLGVLLLDPFASLGAGFWLSFGTVAGILFAFEGRLGFRTGWRDLLPTQLVVTLCLLPLTLALFGTISLIGPLINLIAIPFFSLVLVPAILAGVVLMLLPGGVADLWLRLIERLTAFCWPWFEALASSSLALVHVAHRPAWCLMLLAIGMIVLLMPWPALLRVLGLVLAVPAVTWQPEPLAPGAFELTVLDVGQGLAVFVATRGHALLFDTGPAARSGRATAEFSIVPFLGWHAVERIDVLVLSHSDRDHVGGADAVKAAVDVQQEFVGGELRGHGHSACVAGQEWSWDGVRFAFLHPQRRSTTDNSVDDKAVADNNGSCVLRVTGPGGAALLTGDIEAAAERELRASGDIGKSDVVVVPHHGSRSSSSVEFVAALAPRWAVVSAGYDNRWRFPHPEVIERWRAAGATTLATVTSGAVTFRFGPNGLAAEPEEYRRDARRFWHVD
jgi:competence protein ComEC